MAPNPESIEADVRAFLTQASKSKHAFGLQVVLLRLAKLAAQRGDQLFGQSPSS